MTNLQPNTTSSGNDLKQLVWYLPSGAGGQAAGYKSWGLSKQIRAWGEQHQINVGQYKRESFIDHDDNKKKYYRLIVPEKIATMFMLTWLNERPLKITDYPL